MAENIKLEPKVFEVTVVNKKNEVSLAASGLQGPKGDTGAVGPKGEAGDPAIASFTYENQVGSTVWTIQHNLGFRPAVTVQDYSKTTIEGDVEHIDANNLKVTFSVQVSGYAYLS